ncbi:heavy-metal-associated domain-containing protein [Oscillospiraceae bacterium MB08-C2-2]|nr:heavy-metal-associated domain-containing protein [Oscillospiraceae bacterium MB08-C2-2]
MENGVILHVQGINDKKDEDAITAEIQAIPGIEFVSVDGRQGIVALTGGDMDKLQIADLIEGLGFPVFF